MDKQLLDSLMKIYKGIVVYDIIVIIALFFFKYFSIKYVGGLIAGSLVAMVALFMMARNIESVVDKKTNAKLWASLGYMSRILLYGAILIFAAVSKHINIYTAAVGLISTNIVIKAQQLLSKLNKGKED
ncbi:ATP synthase I chain [Peptostreptococcus sp. D1]|nr:ATP synthase I chain [Peptostreptococcus sp. D1]